MLTKLEAILNANAKPAQALGMEAYMKNRFPFLGIKKPQRAALTKAWIAEARTLSWSDTDALVRELWHKSEREYQYIALDLLMKWKSKAPKEAIDLFLFCIVTKSWWDTVDLIATNLVGTNFTKFPENKTHYITAWRNDPDMWLVRTTLIFQLKYKNETDKDLLASLIIQHADWKEFFIEKAIGWSLRQLAKFDEQWVIHFVQTQSLSNLSKREALKNIR